MSVSLYFELPLKPKKAKRRINPIEHILKWFELQTKSIYIRYTINEMFISHILLN